MALSSDEQNIRECISIILSTRPGERQMMPSFGCRIHELLFAPNTASTATLVAHHVSEALTRWEPRIEVIDVRSFPRATDRSRCRWTTSSTRRTAASPSLRTSPTEAGSPSCPSSPPNLDDRRYENIVSEARALIPQYCPEWTNLGDADPGMTLVQLFAWMTEMTIYRLNRVPDKTYVHFLNFIGEERRPALPLGGPGHLRPAR
ncbi:MAG: GPW/gp25 family protein [Deltaproteobacteria bacterium]|nr:GPW/gp25 family protein [Deltaproteobacteria bacterium]